MIELILLILFAGGLAGAVLISARKMPVAKQILARNSSFKKAGVFETIKNWILARIKSHPKFKDFSWLDFAQKILLKGKVLVLKAENKINDYIAKLRQRAEEQQKKDGAILDNYWHDLKTIVKTKKIPPSDRRMSPESGENPVFSAKPAAKDPAPGQISSEPMIGRVVMPEPARPNRQKKKQSAKKKRFKDPFRW